MSGSADDGSSIFRPSLTVQAHDHSWAAPEFYVVAVYQALRFLGRVGVVPTDHRFVANEMAVLTD
jgi:hypothetical protein